jgi:hypothetical protein
MLATNFNKIKTLGRMFAALDALEDITQRNVPSNEAVWKECRKIHEAFRKLVVKEWETLEIELDVEDDTF